jgi:hypothetical protein
LGGGSADQDGSSNSTPGLGFVAVVGALAAMAIALRRR